MDQSSYMIRGPRPSWISNENMQQTMPVLGKQILDELIVFIKKHNETLGKHSKNLENLVADVNRRAQDLYLMMESKNVMEEVADLEHEMLAEMKHVGTMRRMTEGHLWEFEQAKQKMETAEMTSVVEDMKKRTKFVQRFAFEFEQMIKILVETVELSDEEEKRKAKGRDL